MTNDPDQALISISTIQEFHAEKPELLYCLSRDQALISSYRFTNLFILFNFSLIFRGGYTLKGYNKEICKQLALNLIFKSVHSWISRSSVQESRLTTKQKKSSDFSLIYFTKRRCLQVQVYEIMSIVNSDKRKERENH